MLVPFERSFWKGGENHELPPGYRWVNPNRIETIEPIFNPDTKEMEDGICIMVLVSPNSQPTQFTVPLPFEEMVKRVDEELLRFSGGIFLDEEEEKEEEDDEFPASTAPINPVILDIINKNSKEE